MSEKSMDFNQNVVCNPVTYLRYMSHPSQPPLFYKPDYELLFKKASAVLTVGTSSY